MPEVFPNAWLNHGPSDQFIGRYLIHAHQMTSVEARSKALANFRALAKLDDISVPRKVFIECLRISWKAFRAW